MSLLDDALLISAPVYIWAGAAILTNMILARIFGWKKDQR